METETLIAFVLVVSFSAYVQTVTGFAMGLIIMGAATLFGLGSVAFTAVIVSVTSLFNIVLALNRTHAHVDWHSAVFTCIGVAPALLGGLLLLDYMDATATSTLKRLLGIFILAGGALLMVKPHPRQAAAGGWSHVVAGALGGFFGGLFSTAGPPIVYHLYRQPAAIPAIRASLLAIFGFTTVLRNGAVLVAGDFTQGMALISVLCLPGVWLATALGHRFPPPLSEANMRRLAFGLLTVLGATLVI